MPKDGNLGLCDYPTWLQLGLLPKDPIKEFRSSIEQAWEAPTSKVVPFLPYSFSITQFAYAKRISLPVMAGKSVHKVSVRV